MLDPLDPETYGPPIVVGPGETVHCTGPTRVSAGEWTLRGNAIERSDGARVEFNGYPVYVDGAIHLGLVPFAARGDR